MVANSETQKLKRREYYLANRERLLARQKEYRARNRDQLNARSRAYAAAHRDEARWRAKEWYARHRDADFLDRERQRQRSMYASDPRRRAYLGQWKAANREKHRAYVHVSRGRRDAAGGRGVSVAEWNALVADHGGRCAYCGLSRHLTIDHRIPLSREGRHEIENVLPACRPCNSRKHTMTEEEFRALLSNGSGRRVSESDAGYPSHLRNAFRSCGRPRNSSTRDSAGFAAP